VLKPGGKILLTLKDDALEPFYQRFFDKDWNMHIASWSPQALFNLMDKCSFRGITVDGSITAWPHHAAKVRATLNEKEWKELTLKIGIQRSAMGLTARAYK
jgi:hypothetical protein